MTTHEKVIEKLKEELQALSEPWPKYGTPERKQMMAVKDEIRRLQMRGLAGDGILTYNNNNSGGRWWLTDEDYKALEENGWTVHWIILTKRDLGPGMRDYVSVDTGKRYTDDPMDHLGHYEPGPKHPGSSRDSEIIEVATSYDEAVDLAKRHGAYMGRALATSCAKAGPDPEALVEEWARITGQNPGDEGCNCCGKPHEFEWIDSEGESHYGGIEVTSTFTGFSS